MRSRRRLGHEAETATRHYADREGFYGLMFIPFSLLRSNRERQPRIPPGERVWAIGDIHGRLDLLEVLLRQISDTETLRDEARVRFVLLGDLVDRGPDSRGVIDRALALQQTFPTVMLRGNHDAVFLEAIRGTTGQLRQLLRMGGRETILSYGISEGELNRLDFGELSERLRTAVPPAHVSLLEKMSPYYVCGDYVFVHAGLRPDVPIDEQKEKDLYWIRRDFLEFRGRFEKFVVHGHSISNHVEVRRNRIGLDTGAFQSGKLSAVCLDGPERLFVTTGD